MKNAFSRLFSIKSLKNRNLSLTILAAFLLCSIVAQGQSWNNVFGKNSFQDSLRFFKYKNNPAKDSVLTTDSTGKVVLRFISTTSSARDMTGELIASSASPTITLNNAPLYNTLKLLKNGIRLPPVKYSLSGSTVTLTDARASTDIFQADYKF